EYRNDHDHNQQQNHDGRTIALILLTEGIFIEQIYQRLSLDKRRVGFIHYHEDQVEYLKGADHTGNQYEKDSGRDQRQRNAEELTYAAGSVNVRRFIIISRHFLETGKEKYHVITNDGPDTDHCNGKDRDIRVGHPVYMYSENMVDQTEVCVKQPSPNHSYRCRSRYHRQEENGTVYASALHLPVQKDCQHQRDGNRKRHIYDCIFDRID